jgi:hypothetical protein
LRDQVKHYRCELDNSTSENSKLRLSINKLKQKLFAAVKFVTLSVDDELNKQPSFLNTLMKYNQDIEQRLEQLTQENKNLRGMLQINQDNNSLKSFTELIEKLERESREEKEKISPSRRQEDQEKLHANDIVKQTIRDRNRRVGRKRTESFHFSSMGESSPEDEKKSSLVKLKRKSVVLEFSNYKMAVMGEQEQKKDEEKSESSEQSEDSEEETKKQEEPKPEEPKPEESKQEEKKEEVPATIPGKRKRILSTNAPNDFSALSPPNNVKRRQRNVKVEEGSDFGMMKGSGYKMSIQKPELEEGKSPTSDDDYFG